MAAAETVSAPRSFVELRERLRPYFAILVLSIATFMEVMDMTVVNVALPKIAGEFSITPLEASWIIGAYLIAISAILPINGWLAIYFGRKPYFMGCLALFILSSAACGFATSYPMLLAFRILQGLSGSGLATSEQAMIADMVPPEKLGKAFSIYAMALTVAPIIGPTFGGWMTDNLGWRWIFFINVPIGIISLLFVYRVVEESAEAKRIRAENKAKQGRIDWLGIAFFAAAIGGFELLLEEGPRLGWFDSWFITLLLFAAIACLVLGITWVLDRPNPVVDVRMFTNRNFALSCLLVFVVRFVIMGSTFVIPLMAQTLLGYSAFDAGLLLLPGAVVLTLMMPVVGWTTDKIDIRRLIFAGLVITAASLLYMASFNMSVSFNELATARFVQSLGLSFLSATMMIVGFYHVPSEKNDAASSLISLCSNIGASLGVAASSTYIAMSSQTYINNFGYYTSNYNPAFSERLEQIAAYFRAQGMNALQAAEAAKAQFWETVQQQALMNSFLDVLRIFMVLMVLLLPLVFLLRPRKSKTPPETTALHITE